MSHATPVLTALSLILLALPGTRAEEAKAEYPITTCIVSGEPLGEHGDPVIYKHEGREIRFCCKDCIKDFNKDPARYLRNLDLEIEAAKQKASKHEASSTDGAAGDDDTHHDHMGHTDK